MLQHYDTYTPFKKCSVLKEVPVTITTTTTHLPKITIVPEASGLILSGDHLSLDNHEDIPTRKRAWSGAENQG